MDNATTLPPEGAATTTSYLWIPYIVMSTLLVAAAFVSFLHYHFKHQDRYSRSNENRPSMGYGGRPSATKYSVTLNANGRPMSIHNSAQRRKVTYFEEIELSDAAKSNQPSEFVQIHRDAEDEPNESSSDVTAESREMVGEIEGHLNQAFTTDEQSQSAPGRHESDEPSLLQHSSLPLVHSCQQSALLWQQECRHNSGSSSDSGFVRSANVDRDEKGFRSEQSIIEEVCENNVHLTTKL